MNRFPGYVLLFSVVLLAQLSAQVLAPKRPKTDVAMKSEQTEIYSPVPQVITAPADGVPSDAVVLFGGTNLDSWQAVDGKGPAKWTVADGVMTVVPHTGYIATKQAFGDIQLHLEFREPSQVVGDSQGRGKSGVFFMGLYELQVLDSYDNPTYVNGQAGALYKQYIPLVNASRKPGEWQTYDCVWVTPRFAEDGTLLSPARLTVFHNGVLVEYNIPAKGPTMNVGFPKYEKHPGKLPLVLQDHNTPVSFRNIWVRELKLADYSVSGTAPAPKTPTGYVLITVTPTGSILLNNKEVDDAGLKKGLAAIHKRAPMITVVVSAPPNEQTEQVNAILDACKKAGLDNTAMKVPE